MAPKAVKAGFGGDGGDGRKQPTAQECHLFYTIIKNMKGKPEIDWVAVAADNGFKNAETAKVRYGQVKRKLGLDNWSTPSKAKDANTGNAAGPGGAADENLGFPVPETPTAGRSKKTAAAPSTPTPGTGAGVKKRSGKRATNATSGGRGRKPKAIKQENGDEEDDDMIIVDNPASSIKPEYNSNNNGANAAGIDQYATFPQVWPLDVLQRQAMLVYQNGEWVTTPVSPAVHVDWLARLPAHIQARFYAQVRIHGTNANNNTASGCANVNANANVNSFLSQPDNDALAAADAQLIREAFEAQSRSQTHGGGINNLNMAMAMNMNLNYFSVPAAGGDGNGISGNSGANNIDNQDLVDLHSVPMHPDYIERMKREQEQDAMDDAAVENLFGNGNGGINSVINWDQD